MDIDIDPNFLVLLTLAVAVFGAGRLARVLTYDDFPPAIWARIKWDTLTKDGSWSKLAHCFWCLTPWIMVVCMGWFALGLVIIWVAVAWWAFWGWLALSYVASIIIARDEPK